MITSVGLKLTKTENGVVIITVDTDEMIVAMPIESVDELVKITDRVAAKLATYMDNDGDVHICPWCGVIMGKVRNKIICPECGEIIEE